MYKEPSDNIEHASAWVNLKITPEDDGGDRVYGLSAGFTIDTTRKIPDAHDAIGEKNYVNAPMMQNGGGDAGGVGCIETIAMTADTADPHFSNYIIGTDHNKEFVAIFDHCVSQQLSVWATQYPEYGDPVPGFWDPYVRTSTESGDPTFWVMSMIEGDSSKAYIYDWNNGKWDHLKTVHATSANNWDWPWVMAEMFLFENSQDVCEPVNTAWAVDFTYFEGQDWVHPESSDLSRNHMSNCWDWDASTHGPWELRFGTVNSIQTSIIFDSNASGMWRQVYTDPPGPTPH